MIAKINAKLGYGIAPVVFGQAQQQVKEVLGSPDKKHTTDIGNIDWCYFEKQLVLKFEKENEFRFGWIEVHNPHYTLFQKKIIGLEKPEVLQVISEHISEAPELEDYGSWESMMYSDNWLELHFTLNRLTSFHFGVLYDESGDPIWPSSMDTAV